MRFQCKLDPTTGVSIEQEFASSRFWHVDNDDTSLFKICAMSNINNEPTAAKRKELAVKYQVLTDETAMIGRMRRSIINGSN